MNLADPGLNGVVLLGCGKMGSALLGGWLSRGLEPGTVRVIEPNPSDWLQGQRVILNAGLPLEPPGVCVIAVKPQMMSEALESVRPLGGRRTMFLSIAAGTRISAIRDSVGALTPVIRAMPNTPAAIGKGITALVAGTGVSEEQMRLAEALMAAAGETVRLEDESDIDAVTAVSGSGPAYVFHLIEALAEAARAEGLSEEVSLRLARATVAGAGSLAVESGESPDQLRVNVTSPGGTTAAALKSLMDSESGLRPLIRRAVRAAADRSRELAAGDG